MWEYLNEIFLEFQSVFSRSATFIWFVIATIGFMLRKDQLGVTDVIRDLDLHPRYYESLIQFFRSDAWKLTDLQSRWCQIVGSKTTLLETHNGKIIEVIDGVKRAKEGRYMPGVKRLHQESETSSKPEYMHGHMFGAVGILLKLGSKRFCLPLLIQIQDGIKAIFGWQNDTERQESHVVEALVLAYRAAKAMYRDAIVLMDAYFLTVPVLKKLNSFSGSVQVTLITRARKNCIAYHDIPPRVKGQKGAKRKKGKTVKLQDLFQTASFEQAEVELYGRNENVDYFCIDLLWRQRLYQKLRFVLVNYDKGRAILVSTDLTLEPPDIIALYGKRFSIESMFRGLNQFNDALGYHFWTKSMPKLSYYQKKNHPDPLENVTNSEDRVKITQALKATEGYVFISSVAFGLLQLLSLTFYNTLSVSDIRYLRTSRHTLPSEASLQDYLARQIYRFMAFGGSLAITQIIQSKQKGLMSFVPPPKYKKSA